MRHTRWAVLVALAVLFPSAGYAQVAWDSPFLIPPRDEPGFGLFLIDAAGGELGVLGMWRSPSWNFGIRGGVAEEGGPDDDVSVFGGIDFSGMLTRASDEFPLDVDWILGAGLGIGDNLRLSVPVGLTSGHSFTGDGVVFTPYASPRVVLDALLGDDEDEDDDDLTLDLAFDLGLDLRFSSAFTVRFGATLGDREAVAIGLVF